MPTTFEVTLNLKRIPLEKFGTLIPLRDSINTTIWGDRGASDTRLLWYKENGRPVPECYKKPMATVEACGGGAQVFQMRGGCDQGLYDAALLAFSAHYPLMLSPDDVWLTLVQGFSKYVELNAEQVRPLVVSFEDTKKLSVRRDTFVRGSADNDWPGCFAEWAEQIKSNTKPKTYERVVCDFSTTGPLELAVSQLQLMAVTKSFFSYECRTMCGIPAITLLGSVEDWQKLQAKAACFADYGMGWWTSVLLPVLDEFVKAAQGQPDISWWTSFFKHQSMSGGDVITGHINKFFPYCKVVTRTGVTEYLSRPSMITDRQPDTWSSMSSSAIPGGLLTVPFNWDYYGKVFPMTFHGGLAGVVPQRDGIKPVPVWSVADGTTL